jgi:catechol 2,3-dioxygenase-like lactoylglutathione lyase family enzyme
MFKAITHTQIWVLDQDEALDFYVGKLGFEVNTDADLEFMRWLTINLPGQPDREILLEVPKVAPYMDEDTAEQIRDLLSKGAVGVAMILSTDDCRATYEELSAKGVEFTEEPVERFYGIDCAIRDPFGNHIRITEPAPVPAAEAPSERTPA